MTKANLQKLVLAILSAAIFGSFTWIRDMDLRMAIIEDDLDETVTIIGVLHPPSPSPSAILAPPELMRAGLVPTGDGCGPRCKKRRQKLKELRPERPPPDAAPSPDGSTDGGPQEAPDAAEDPGVAPDVPGC